MSGATACLFDLAGRVAVVTGATSGIGRMIAAGFAGAGARVHVVSRTADSCRDVATELQLVGDAHALPADVSDPAGVSDLASRIAELESGVDVLVNAAGITWGAAIGEHPAERFGAVLATNLQGPFLLTQALLPLLEAHATSDDPGRVINIGSIDGVRVPEFESYGYAASKAGLHHLTRHLARFLAPRGITVNAIAPGFFPSRMSSFLMEDEASVAATIPLGRVGEPDDVWSACQYLSSRAGRYMTGAVLPVDGGLGVAGTGGASSATVDA